MYARVLDGWLGVDSTTLLGGDFRKSSLWFCLEPATGTANHEDMEIMEGASMPSWWFVLAIFRAGHGVGHELRSPRCMKVASMALDRATLASRGDAEV